MVRVSPVPYSVRRPRKLSSVDLLPRVVIRPVALGMAGVACCLMVAGCASFDKALGQSTVTVYFTDNTTPATMIKIMNACNNVNPNVKEEQNPAHTPPEDIQVIYNTTGANDTQIAQLEECLNKYPQVQGINPEDSSDDS
jgi:ABC-type glycerol-3-phosphate transport system substrate-binding protein